MEWLTWGGEREELSWPSTRAMEQVSPSLHLGIGSIANVGQPLGDDARGPAAPRAE